MIRVQEEPFDIAAELAALRNNNHKIGGTTIFAGSVRDLNLGEHVSAMTLEHYPGMTEKMLGEIEAEALARWPLDACLLIHRYGRLEPGERIVFVLTASAHREASFEASMFLVDWLKTKAPFWKLEDGAKGAKWVAARDSDDEAAARWAPKATPKAAE